MEEASNERPNGETHPQETNHQSTESEVDPMETEVFILCIEPLSYLFVPLVGKSSSFPVIVVLTSVGLSWQCYLDFF